MKIAAANHEAVVDCSGVITYSSVKKGPTLMVENTSKIFTTQVRMTHQYQWNMPGRPPSMKIAAANNEAVADCSDVITCSSVKKEPTMMVENTAKILSTQVCMTHQHQRSITARLDLGPYISPDIYSVPLNAPDSTIIQMRCLCPAPP